MKMIYVKWLDHSGCDFWARLDEIKNAELAVCESIGYLIDQDEEVLRMSSTIGHKQLGEDSDKYAHSHILAKKLIVEIRDMSLVKKEPE